MSRTNMCCEPYLDSLRNRLQSPGLEFALSTTDQNYWLAFKLGQPIRQRQYCFVIAHADGASQTPDTLEQFIDESFNISYTHFKKDFNFFLRLFWRTLVLVPVIVSSTAYPQDVVDKSLEHKDRDWNVTEIPTLVRVSSYSASNSPQQLSIQILGRGANTPHNLIERALNINIAAARRFSYKYSLRQKIIPLALASLGAGLVVSDFLHYTPYSPGKVLLATGIYGTISKIGD